MKKRYRATSAIILGLVMTLTAAAPSFAYEDDWEGEMLVNDLGTGESGGPGVSGGSGNRSTYDSYFPNYDSSYYDFYDQCAAMTSEEDARAQMITVTVPVWHLSGDRKSASTASVTVNRGIADAVKQIFQEIYDGPQQFPMSDVGGFTWRGDTSRSEHNWGTALDLNSNSNYCVYTDGTIVGDHWTPGEDPYSFSADSDVVKAFKNHGFSWGGDWPWGNLDYMHFSYFGT